MAKIKVDDISVNVVKFQDSDFISLTDIAKRKTEEPNIVIGNWMRNRNTINTSEHGKRFIIPLLTPSNSRGLKRRPV